MNDIQTLAPKQDDSQLTVTQSDADSSNMREVNYTVGGDFVGILRELGASLLISTYQAGKVIAVSAGESSLQFSFHNFERPMGMALGSDRLAVASKKQIWFLNRAGGLSAPNFHSARNTASQDNVAPSHDACFLTRSSRYTDEIQVHELAWCKQDADDELWIVNTLFSCLCTLHPQHNFVPRWQPPFITELAPQDRCHLNGLATENGLPKYVSVLGQTNAPEGWRAGKATGGCVIDVPSGETIATGFAMPHSPRLHHESLWLLDSGLGRLVSIDQTTGATTPIEHLPGFLRGLALRNNYAFVGLSKIRETSSFGGIPIAEKRDELRCGVGIVDLSTGRSIASLQFTSGVDEIFDVQLLDGVSTPSIHGPFAESDGQEPIWYLPSQSPIESSTQVPSVKQSHPASEIFDQIEQVQWKDKEAVQQWQLQQLRPLLQHCREQVPFYREKFASIDTCRSDIHSMDSFRKLPVTTREMLHRNAPAFLAERLPRGVSAIGTAHTSGTTGVPVTVHRTNLVSHWWLACFRRDLEWAGVDPTARLAALRKISEGQDQSDLHDGIECANWGSALEGFLTTGTSFLMDVAQDPSEQLRWLAAVQPEYLISYPSNVQCLASLAIERQIRFPRLQLVHTIAEELTTTTRTQIESAFGVDVRDTYTCEEAGYIASQCPTNPENYHVHDENVIVEVLDENNQPSAPGDSGRLVITTLHNHLMPLLRYDIGDDVTLAATPCSCDRGLLTLQSIQGKARPTLVTPGGLRKSSHVLAGHIRQVGGFHQFQFRQASDNSVRLTIVPDQSWSSAHEQKMKATICGFFESEELDLSIQTASKIARAASGKLQSFVSQR